MMERGPGAEQASGIARAIGAAVLFGAGVPLIQRASVGAGPFATSGILYAGAAALFGLSLFRRRPAERGEAPIARSQIPLLGAIALLGAVLAPAALVWGLARSSGLSASLLLNAEGAFTVLFAWWINRERLGGRLAVAVLLIFAGSAVIVSATGASATLGTLAVAAATLGWAADSTLASRLSGADPRAVVAAKSALGAVLSFMIAAARHEPLAGLQATAALVVIGAVSYGASLHLYLSSQRSLGAARAGAFFSVGPFAGALAALALGDRPSSLVFLPATALLVAGVWLQARDRHAHEHRHAPMTHDHRHTHDDGHHDHVHDPMPDGPHSHPHDHDERLHAHEHADDAHHRHGHDR